MLIWHYYYYLISYFLRYIFINGFSYNYFLMVFFFMLFQKNWCLADKLQQASPTTLAIYVTILQKTFINFAYIWPLMAASPT